MKKTILIISCLIISIVGFAQKNISGKIVGKETKTELPFANLLLSQNDTSKVYGIISELDGSFKFQKIPRGVYQLKISVIGYETLVVDTISVADKNVKMGSIKLASSSYELQEFNVVAEQSHIETKAGKKVINVGEDIVNSGGSAVEVLSMAPSVEVGVGGAISIRGESDVMVLINGRITALSFIGAGNALKQIPASSIEKIEIITNAGAEHGPDGMGGMINVILKKEKSNGWEFTSGGNLRYAPFSGSVNAGLAYKKDKLGFNFNYSLETENDIVENTEKRDYLTFVDQNKSMLSKSEDKTKGITNFLIGGASYAFNDSTSLELNLFYENGNHTGNTESSYDIEKTDGSLSHSKVSSEHDGGESFSGFEASFMKHFKNDSELSIFGTLGTGNFYNNIENNNLQADIPVISSSKSDSKFFESEMGVEYQWPVFDFLSFHLGGEASLMKFNVDQKTILEEEIKLKDYQFNQDKYAVYAISNWNLAFFELGLGARLESYKSLGEQKDGTSFTQNYQNIYPNIQLATGFGGAKVEQGLMFSYSKRINRPEYEQLNPTIDYSDPLNLVKGNPDLEPEFAHVLELSHELSVSDITLFTTLFHRVTTNVIQEKKEILEDNVILTSYVNESNRTNSGVELYLKYDVFGWLDLTNDFSIYKKSFLIKEGEIGNKDGVNWHNKTICNIKPGGGWKMQLQGKYIGKSNSLYYTYDPYYTLNIGVNKDVLKGKAKLSLSVKDVFNSTKLVSTGQQEDFIIHNTTKYNTRMIILGFFINI